MSKIVAHFKLEVDLEEGKHFIAPENATDKQIIKAAKKVFYPFLRGIVKHTGDLDEWSNITVRISQEDGD